MSADPHEGFVPYHNSIVVLVDLHPHVHRTWKAGRSAWSRRGCRSCTTVRACDSWLQRSLTICRQNNYDANYKELTVVFTRRKDNYNNSTHYHYSKDDSWTQKQELLVPHPVKHNP